MNDKGLVGLDNMKMISIFKVKKNSEFRAPPLETIPYSKSELKEADKWWGSLLPVHRINVYRGWLCSIGTFEQKRE